MNREDDIDIDDSSENVLSEWPRAVDRAKDEHEEVRRESGPVGRGVEGEAWSIAAPAPAPQDEDDEHEPEPGLPEAEPDLFELDAEPEPEPDADSGTAIVVAPSLEHAAGDLEIPEGYAVLEGIPDGGRRAVGIVVSRFNGNVTSRLLDRALEELEVAGVRRDAITIMVVPGAFELPVAATALAKTRRFACIVGLGCVIRGDTPHFDYVASEAASGLQLAALETGVPVSFGLLTLDRVEQAEPRIEKGAEAVRSALEMADVFSHLRAAASR